jgi:single-strand DNA-binding protein
MYQQITIIGNCGRDPEMRYTNEGIGVCNFSVAVNKRRKNANTGEYTDVTTWFKVSAWRNLAETCSQYVHKGMLVMIVGEVKCNAYVGQDGQARASLEITTSEVKFLSRSDASENEASGQQQSGHDEDDWINNDDIPF